MTIGRDPFIEIVVPPLTSIFKRQGKEISMPSYRTNWPLKHDGHTYSAEEVIDLPAAAALALLAGGVLTEVADDVEEEAQRLALKDHLVAIKAEDGAVPAVGKLKTALGFPVKASLRDEVWAEIEAEAEAEAAAEANAGAAS